MSLSLRNRQWTAEALALLRTAFPGDATYYLQRVLGTYLI